MVIEARQICKEVFQPHRHSILAPLDLHVQKGECLALLGANGSGKSTLLKMLTGVLTPTSGEVRVLGRHPMRERRHLTRQIGVVFGHRSSLLWDLPLRDSLKLYQHMYGVPESDFRRRQAELLDLFGIVDLLNRPVKHFSLGQRMKAELVSVMLHQPAVLFLDEPTLGLDVVVRAHMKEHLRQLNRLHDTTILLTSHDMGDIDGLCHRAVILQKGECIYNGSLHTLQQQVAHRRKVVLKTLPEVDMNALQHLLGKNTPITCLEDQVLKFELSTQDSRTPKILQELLGRNDILDLQVTEVDLEQVIRDLFIRSPETRSR